MPEPKTYIIAEIGSNHAQDLDLAKASIRAAQAAGANAVKFQSIDLNALYFEPSPETRALHQLIDLPEDWYPELMNCAQEVGIDFFSSPTYLGAIDLLEAVQVKYFKLASAQVGTFPQLVERVAQLRKPTFLSTGLVNYAELTRVIEIFQQAGNTQYTILHCNSLYPPRYQDVNLGLMDVYRQMFQCPVGYSDHSSGIYMPLAAVARGAQVIEKHFVLNSDIVSPDVEISIQPEQFADMVKGIRAIEESLQTRPRLSLHPDELAFKQRICTRLILKRDKLKGHAFQADDFVYLRHPEGIDCQYQNQIIDTMCAIQDLSQGQVLNWSDLTGKTIINA